MKELEYQQSPFVKVPLSADSWRIQEFFGSHTFLPDFVHFKIRSKYVQSLQRDEIFGIYVSIYVRIYVWYICQDAKMLSHFQTERDAKKKKKKKKNKEKQIKIQT